MGTRTTLDPTLDVVFKMLLTQRPESHELLVSLLTAVIRPPSPLARVEVRNPEIPSADALDRSVVLDLHVQLADGTRFDVEMQSDKRPAFRERALYYWARLYGSELERGDEYDALRPVISVLFLDYRELRGARLHSTFHVLEVHDHERFSDALAVHVIELPKIAQATARERIEEIDLIRWSRFFAARTDEELAVVAMENPVLEKARQALQAVSDDPVARESARLRANARVVRRMEDAALRAEGRAEGHAEGRAETLRVSIVGLCQALSVPLDDVRRSTLAQSDADALQHVFDALVRDRVWPV